MNNWQRSVAEICEDIYTLKSDRAYARAGEIAAKAADLVGGDRAKTHGDFYQNCQNIAHVWNGILSAAGKHPPVALDGHDVATMFEGAKMARRYSGSYNVDDYIDAAGYADIAGRIAGRDSEI